MAEDQQSGSDKTEQATPKRRQQAREEGDVPKSNDLSGALMLTGMMIALWLFGQGLFTQLMLSARYLMGEAIAGRQTPGDAGRVFTELGGHLLLGMLPIAVAAVVVAVFAHVVQTGPLLAPKKLKPKPETLNPVQGFKKIFGEPKTYVAFAMNVVKVSAVAVVAWLAMAAAIPQFGGLTQLDRAAAFAAGGWIVLGVAFKVIGALLILAILDYGWQKVRHEQQLKMTKQQVKEEMKSMEGDPQIKARRRQIAQQQAMQRAKQSVPQADFVVTNPTHYAVAIKYDAATMTAPTVLAKGADLVALKIRELAKEHAVPVIERPPLARALWKDVGVGEEIEESFYSAVAEILAYVYEIGSASERRSTDLHKRKRPA